MWEILCVFRWENRHQFFKHGVEWGINHGNKCQENQWSFYLFIFYLCTFASNICQSSSQIATLSVGISGWNASFVLSGGQMKVVPSVLGSEFRNQCPAPSAFLKMLCYRRIKPSILKHITVSKECVMLYPKLQSMVSQTANCDCPTKPMYSCSCQNRTCQLYLCDPIIQYHPCSWPASTHTIADRQHHHNYEKAWTQSSDGSRYVSILLEIWYCNTCSMKCVFRCLAGDYFPVQLWEGISCLLAMNCFSKAFYRQGDQLWLIAQGNWCCVTLTKLTLWGICKMTMVWAAASTTLTCTTSAQPWLFP